MSRNHLEDDGKQIPSGAPSRFGEILRRLGRASNLIGAPTRNVNPQSTSNWCNCTNVTGLVPLGFPPQKKNYKGGYLDQKYSLETDIFCFATMHCTRVYSWICPYICNSFGGGGGQEGGVLLVLWSDNLDCMLGTLPCIF